MKATPRIAESSRGRFCTHAFDIVCLPRAKMLRAASQAGTATSPKRNATFFDLQRAAQSRPSVLKLESDPNSPKTTDAMEEAKRADEGRQTQRAYSMPERRRVKLFLAW